MQDSSDFEIVRFHDSTKTDSEPPVPHDLHLTGNVRFLTISEPCKVRDGLN